MIENADTLMHPRPPAEVLRAMFQGREDVDLIVIARQAEQLLAQYDQLRHAADVYAATSLPGTAQPRKHGDDLTPLARPVNFQVTCLPDDAYGGWSWDVNVQFTGASRFGKRLPDTMHWAVRLRDTWRLNYGNTWDFEPLPSERDDGWFEAHAFSLDEALRRAKQLAPTIVINDRTPAQVLEQRAQRDTR